MSQYIGYFNDPGLSNVYCTILSGQTLFNGTAFETYAVGHVALYGNYMTDPNGTGYYTVAVPAGLPVGNYVVNVYQRVGATISLTGDTRLGSQSLPNPVESSTPVVVSDLVARLRILTNDYSDSNRIYYEGANPATDGSKTIFKLQYQNITANSVYWSDATHGRTASGFSMDYTNGLATFTVAPAAGVGLTFDYTYEWFTDTDYQEFLVQAANILIYDDPDDVPTGLQSSLLQFGSYFFNMKRATAYAPRYASSGGTASESVSSATNEFQKLAQLNFKNGSSMRDNFYTSAGRQKSVAYGQMRTKMDPYTPRR